MDLCMSISLYCKRSKTRLAENGNNPRWPTRPKVGHEIMVLDPTKISITLKKAGGGESDKKNPLIHSNDFLVR